MKSGMKKMTEVRGKILLALVKEGTNATLIERELAFLAIDIVLALKTEKLARSGCQCFREIDFAIRPAAHV
jgi:hypothetical protein